MKIFKKILPMLLLGFMAVVISGCGGSSSTSDGNDDPIIPPQVTLDQIRISPENLTLPSGVKVQYEATGIYSDGNEKDITDTVAWSSDNTSIATVSASGEVESIAEGIATITAEKDGISVTTKVRVGQEPVTDLASIQLTLANGSTSATVPVGTTGSLVATAIMTDGVTFNANAFVTFTSSSASVEIGVNGYVSAMSVGDAEIIASYTSVRSNMAKVTVTAATLQSITISPVTVDMHINDIQAFIVHGTYSDGSIVDITKDTSFSSSDISVVTVGGNEAKAIAAGNAVITATAGSGISATADVTVSRATLESIQLMFANGTTDITIPKGITGSLVATAKFSDGTSSNITGQVNYMYDSGVVNVQSNGNVAAIGTGSSDIIAKFGGVSSNVTKVTVTNAMLQSIIISSDKSELIVGSSTILTAIGIYSDGRDVDITKDVSFHSDDITVLTVIGNEAKGVGIGTANIVATLAGVTGTLSMEVNQAQVTALRIVKDDSANVSSDEFVVGETLKVKALADFDNGMKNVDVTTKVTWQSKTPTTVSVNENGLITALNAGYAEVLASYQGEFGQASDKITGNVIAKTVTNIQIFADPANATAPAGENIKMEAWATYNDGSNHNVSDTVKWTSSDSKVIINNVKDEKYVYVTAMEVLNATIEVENSTGIEASQTVTFEEKVFDHIEIQEGYCEGGTCPVITGQTVDIPIVDNVEYDPVSLGAYYPTAWLVFTDGTKQYINTTSGIRWWSADQIRAYVNTLKGSFVFGRGLGNGIEISVSYRGEHKTSFFVNVVQDTTTKTLQEVGIINTQELGWGCSQIDEDYGEKLTMLIGDEGKYLMACGKFQYSDGSIKWEDINNNVAWLSSDSDVARVQNLTGELKALGGGTAIISAQLAGIKGELDVLVEDKTISYIEIQERWCEGGTCPVITGQTVDIPIVDDVEYDPVSLGAYYPTAWLVFTDGTKQYINTTSGIRWWSADQIRAYVNTLKGSFVFGRGLGNGIGISVSYRGNNETSFFVNVKEDTSNKILTVVGIKNTKDLGWGCTQNDADYGTPLTVDLRILPQNDLQACGKFSYSNGTPDTWEDINDNVAWSTTDRDVAYVRTTTGKLKTVKPGNVTISAQVAGIDGDIDVTVNP